MAVSDSQAGSAMISGCGRRIVVDFPVFLALGFRPFFTAAAVFSLLPTSLWLGIYLFGWDWQPGGLPGISWHAHEMVFGYAMAVIAGFLLTAVKNWTGVQTLRGFPLLLLILLWLAARCLLLFGDAGMLPWAAVADLLFNLGLLAALACPVFKVRQFRQVGILSKVLLLMLANLLFYISVTGSHPWGVHASVYSGVYLVMALIFVMSRRVVPFFVERGLGEGVTVTNRAWLDAGSLLLFVAFWLADILEPDSLLAAGFAAGLCVLHGMRLAGWYAVGICKQPLLWVLFLAYLMLVVGFALKAAVAVFAISPLLSLHAFTFGGIGLFTLGMMARVTIGHTGRNISAPPPAVAWMFGLLVVGSVFRVFLPLLDARHYVFWMGLSQIFWIAAFLLFLLVFVPMLVQPRVDGQPG